MTTKNLSSAASHVIGAYGIAATNVINAYRFGGERLFGYVDTRVARALKAGTPTLGEGLSRSLASGQKRISGYSVQGIQFGSDGATRVVGTAVDLATKGVGLVAGTATRLDRATSFNALDAINRFAMPAARLFVEVAERVEEGSTALVKRVAGRRMPAKAVATRRLKTATRKAAATRKQATRSATRQIDKVEAATQRATRKATKRVSQAVAKTATQTSNAARRVARKAQAAAA